MKAMLKFPLNVGMNVLQIHGGIDVATASVESQTGQSALLQMWTLVDSSKELQGVHIYVAVTGEPLPENVHYINLGTVLMHGGGFVVHALLLKDA